MTEKWAKINFWPWPPVARFLQTFALKCLYKMQFSIGTPGPVMLYIQLAVDWRLTSELLIALGCSRVVSDFLDPMFFAPLTSIILISESTTLTPTANTTHFPTSKGNQRSVADPDSPRPSSSTLSSKQKIFVGAGVFGCVVFVVFFGIGIYCHQRKKKLGKGAKYGLDCSPKQSEITVEYIAQDSSVVGSSPSCELTVPMMRQESRNLTKVSEVDMSVGENWEIGRELINLQEVLGEGAFGRVMKAEVFGIPNMPFRCHVAVKMLKGGFCI